MTTIISDSAPAHPAGDQTSQSQADFYGKLLQLQQDVLTGRHPRYKLPPPAFEHSGLAPLAAPSFGVVAKQPFSNGVLPSQLVPAPLSTIPATGVAHQKPPSSDTQTARPAPSGVASGNPLKPDNLVKAENSLKRLRIEKSLKEATDSKKTRSGEKDANPWFGAHTFNCSQLLQAATSLVKPVSGFETVTANVDRPSGSPPNTDSYYSSKVDSITDDREKEIRSEDGEIEDATAQASFESLVDGLGLQRPQMSGLGPQSPRSVAAGANAWTAFDEVVADIVYSDDHLPVTAQVTPPREDSYSPPSADSFPFVPNPRPTTATFLDNFSRTQAALPQTSGTRPPTGRSRESESYSPPPVETGPSHTGPGAILQPANGQLGSTVRGHGLPITNGRPARNARKLQNKKQDNSNTSGTDRRSGKNKKTDGKPYNVKPQVPNGHSAPSNGIATTVNAAPLGLPALEATRKRRREPEAEDNNRLVSGRIHQPNPMPLGILPSLPASPVPYIKQEPVSPQLLPARIGAEPPRRLVLREDGTADIQIEPARTQPMEREPTRADDLRLSRQIHNSSPRYVQQEPAYLDEDMQPSPVYRRKPMRDDTDLRRLASMQHARRVPSPPGLEISPRSVRLGRAPSQQDYEQSSSRYQYVEEDFDAPRIIRTRRSSPTLVQDDYSPRARMPPPPPAKRRIVVDEYGNEYVAIPAGSNMRHSLPSEYFEEPEVQPRHRMTSAIPVRQPLYQPRTRTRAEPEVIELDDDEDQPMMAPPPRLLPQKRRLAPIYDYATPQEQPQYAPRPMSRAVSSQVGGRLAEQQQVRYVSAGTYGPQYDAPEPRQRTYSARPDVSHQRDMLPAREEWPHLRRM